MKRPKKPRRQASYRPHRCVVLAVDPGRHAGWAIWGQGRLVQWGEVDGLDFEAVRAVVAAAVQLFALASVPCVLVLERPPVHHRGGKRSFASLLGSGETRASWRLAWVSCRQPNTRRLTVDPQRWRDAVGIGRVSRETAKAAELVRARLVVQDSGAVGPVVGQESAPAILIGSWAARAGEVGAVLPQSAREEA